MVIITLAFWLYQSGAEPIADMRAMPSIEACWDEAKKLQAEFAAAHAPKKHVQFDVSCVTEWYEGDPA
jgi:hypothetical protein